MEELSKKEELDGDLIDRFMCDFVGLAGIWMNKTRQKLKENGMLQLLLDLDGRFDFIERVMKEIGEFLGGVLSDEVDLARLSSLERFGIVWMITVGEYDVDKARAIYLMRELNKEKPGEEERKD